MAFYFHVFQGRYQKFHFHGDHKPRKHGERREFVKLLKSQGNFNFCRKNLENSGKMKNMGHDRQQKYILLNFLLLSCPGKNLKCPKNLRENSVSRNLVSQKCGHPDFMYTSLLISANMAFGIPTELLF